MSEEGKKGVEERVKWLSDEGDEVEEGGAGMDGIDVMEE